MRLLRLTVDSRCGAEGGAAIISK